MQAMTQFQFHTHAIRVFPTDDAMGFMAVAADVAEALEYDTTAHLMRCVDEEDKGYTNVDTLGGTQRMLAISEAGVYNATFRSRKPSAKAFRRWVTSEVLPAIRRTGAYVHPAASDSGQAQLALAREIGSLRDQLQAQNGMILHLYQQLDGARRGHIRALSSVMSLEKRNAAREAKELVILLESQGVPRTEIAARSGKNLNHIRQIVHQAKLAGRLPRQGEFEFSLD